MAERTKHDAVGWVARWSPALLVAGLVIFHAINNWIWLGKNVVIRGWDRIGALVNSLYYHQTLSELSLKALFNATIQDAIRPPLFGMSMAAMYKLFGVSTDIAVMVNVLYWLILLAASYGIGAKLGGRRLGMLGTVLVALIPMVFAMSRYSYFEFSLAALTAASIYLLLASDRFERRGASILLGVALGLGALIKRTFPVFGLGALVVVSLQAGLPRKIWIGLRAGPRPRWRDVGLAVGGGLLLSALWYFPNQEAAQRFSAGFWLFPIWGALAAAGIFFVLRPPSAVTNFMAGCFISMSIASAWYAPQGLEFVTRLLRTAWGVKDPRGRTVDFARLDTYSAYLQSMLYAFSLIFAVLLVLAIGLVLLSRFRKWHRPLPIRWWDWGWWPIIATIVIAYAILTTSIYKEDRAITPLLPFLALLLAAALLALPWRRLRVAAIALTITFGLVQFFAISYTEMRWLVRETQFRQQVLGQRGLFAQGLYLETPDSGQNDPGYWIAGDVLQRVEATRQREGWDTISLGIIAYSSHVHAGMFAYDQLRLYPAIQIEDPTQTYPQESTYSTAFRYDYVVVLRNKNRREVVREAEKLILEERRTWFKEVFEEETRYLLPDESEATLFRRRHRPSVAHDASALYEAAAYLKQTSSEQDLIIVQPPELLTELLEYYWGPAPVSDQVSGKDLAQHPRFLLLTDQDVKDDLEALLSGIGPSTQEAWFGPLQIRTFEIPPP